MLSLSELNALKSRQHHSSSLKVTKRQLTELLEHNCPGRTEIVSDTAAGGVSTSSSDPTSPARLASSPVTNKRSHCRTNEILLRFLLPVTTVVVSVMDGAGVSRQKEIINVFRKLEASSRLLPYKPSILACA